MALSRKQHAQIALSASIGALRINALQDYLSDYQYRLKAIRTLIYQALISVDASKMSLLVNDLETAGLPTSVARDYALEALDGPEGGQPLKNPRARKAAYQLISAAQRKILIQDLEALQGETNPETRMRFVVSHTDVTGLIEALGPYLLQAYNEADFGFETIEQAELTATHDVYNHFMARASEGTYASIKILNDLVVIPSNPVDALQYLQHRSTSPDNPGTPYLDLTEPTLLALGPVCEELVAG